jgi:catechol 2,3-dioxygenase-like lactoylglutathione lyase family enzyme
MEGLVAAQIYMISIFASDLTRMVAFYRDVISFPIEWDGQGPYAEFKHEGVRFSMFKRSELPALLGAEPSFPIGLNGTFELALDLPHFEDVDPEFRRPVSAGATPVYDPRNEPWGMRSSMIADPEGNLFEVGSWSRG